MIRIRLRCSLCCLFLLATAGSSHADDWPMWRHDAQRSGTTSAQLPDELKLQWTRELPAPMPAWPNEQRLHFDASYEPIVVGKTMFVGSMVNGSLTALDTRSGKERWRFYTNGPIRLAPVAFDDRVVVGSDDGFLYCLDGASGDLHWKVAGAPEDREQRWHLGNARLVSFWPVRGGPVVADGVVYFGAGIWPTMGVFVRAVDAKTGKVLWTNDDSHAIENVRVDHNYVQESGISPQGHMLIKGDMLIVPNGRSMPARIDRATGKLYYFVQGYRNGDSRVTISGDIALVGRTGVVSLKDGRELGSRWAAAGGDAPKSWSGPKADLFEGPLFPYKFQTGCDYRAAIDGAIAYGVDDGTVYAYDLAAATTSLQEKEFNGKPIKPARWDAPVTSEFPTPFKKKELVTNTTIKVGSRVYSHAGRQLFAVDVTTKGDDVDRVVWTHELAAEPTSMVVADDRLFVVASDGAIHCFGGQSSEPQRYPASKAVALWSPDKWTERAKQIVAAAKADRGYAVVAGLAEGRLVDELLTKTEFHVVAIDSKAKTIERLRRNYSADERYRSRFQAIVADPATIELPPYIATLMCSEDASPLSFPKRLPELFKSLRPYGGVLAITRTTEIDGQLRTDPFPPDVSGAKYAVSADQITVTREGALPGSADWTHETGDAGRSFFSQDGLVKAPLAVLWYGDGRDHGFHKRKDYGHGLKPQVAGGRLVALQVATNTLKAVDAYTGLLLWSRKLGNSARYASLPSAIYVADERTCLVLDPDTGETRKTFALKLDRPESQPVSASDIRVDDDLILIAIRFNDENTISKGRWDSQMLVALDRTTGKQLWSRKANDRFNTAAIAVANGRVYCVDSHSLEEVGLRRRRGDDVDGLSSTITALDVQTGRELWKVDRNDPPPKLTTLHFMGMRTQDDWLCYSAQHDLVVGGKGDNTFALNAETGGEVWHKPVRGQQPLIVGDETFINQTGHTYDIRTGGLVSGDALFKRGGCNYAVGGKNLLFLRSNCATYVDVSTKQEYAIRNLRSGCSNSLVAANGLLNAPCFSVGCVCNYPIQTSFAMFHLPESMTWHGVEPVKQ